MSLPTDRHEEEEPPAPEELDTLLDAGLRAGFAGGTPDAAAAEGSGTLGEEGAEPSPSPRYVIESELGAGGMGRVLRARDRVMGRFVALKVMSPEAPAGSARVERFWEEAQIASQLQHPGIVPVYDLGRSASLQPYFTMKLVDGETLRARLRGRPSVAHDRQRFLQWFVQACQAAAFAHAQGVVHRDLKPANIMIGEFGELHVMDWGLAKIMGAPRSAADAASPVRTLRGSSPAWHSRSGGAIGTPDYMAPEQAMGQGASVDPRADVFSLGVILLEILTGESLGGRGADRLPDSGLHHELRDAARVRLRTEAVDDDLAGIALDCLAWAAEDRPRDAGVLAARMQRWADATLERARAAEVAARTARIRVHEQRRRARLQLGYAGALIALLVIGGVLYVSWERRRERHRAATERAVSEAIEFASAARGRAEAAATEVEALAACAEADQAAGRALDIARAGGAGAGVLRRSESTVAALTEVTARIRATLEGSRRERDALERIQKIRMLPAIRWDLERVHREYGDVLQSLGIDIAEGEPAEAAQRIRETGIADHLVEALDDWIMTYTDWRVLRREPLPDPHCSRLLAVAQATDDDPVRRAVRSALHDRDLDALRRLAAGSALEAARSGTIMLVARALGTADGAGGAVPFLRRMHGLHPGEFWINVSLAFWLRNAEPPELAEALVHDTAAVAAVPESAPARLLLGLTCHRMGSLDTALQHYAAAVRLHPTYPYARLQLGRVLRELDREDEAEVAVRATIGLDEDLAEAHGELARIHLKQRRFAEAIGAARRSVGLEPGIAEWRRLLGITLEKVGELDASEAALRAALDLDGDDAASQGALARVLERSGRREEAVAAYRAALSRDPSQAIWHYNLGNLLAAGEDFLGAEACYRSALVIEPAHPQTHVNLGQALRCQGRFEEALASLRRGHELGSRRPDWSAPSAEALQQCELALEAEQRLLEVLDGERVPSIGREWIGLARHCEYKRHHAQEARVWQLGFAADPDLAEQSRNGVRHRFRAATVALRAGLGMGMDGPDLEAAERVRWLGQARSWLRDEIDGLLHRVAENERQRRRVAGVLAAMLETPPISDLRAPELLNTLPDSERQPWRELLAAIDEARARCEE